MPAHRSSRQVSALRFDDRFARLDPSIGVPVVAGSFLPFGPFRAQHKLLCAALSIKPSTAEYLLPLVQPFRRCCTLRLVPMRYLPLRDSACLKGEMAHDALSCG